MVNVSQLSVRQVPIKDLQIPDIKIRGAKKDTKEFVTLMSSIRQNGIYQPVIARPIKGSTQLELIDGLQRTTAATECGLTHVPAYVGEWSDDDVFIIQAVLNTGRVQQTPVEMRQHLIKFMGLHPELNQTQLAELFSVTQTQISNLLSWDNLTKDSMKLVESGKIKATAATFLAGLPAEAQTPDVLKRAMTDSVTEFQAFCKSLKRELSANKRGSKEEGVLPFRPLSRDELIVIYSEVSDEINSMSPDDENYKYVSGRWNMIKQALQVDDETLAERERQKSELKRKKEIEKARKEKESADKVLKELQAEVEDIN